jgi:hypothetical protein
MIIILLLAPIPADKDLIDDAAHSEIGKNHYEDEDINYDDYYDEEEFDEDDEDQDDTEQSQSQKTSKKSSTVSFSYSAIS